MPPTFDSKAHFDQKPSPIGQGSSKDSNSKTFKPKTLKLQKLEEKKAQVLREIQLIREMESTQRKKEETRRKILAGSWLLKEIEEGRFPLEKFMNGLDEYLTRPSDRAIFDLPFRKEK